MSTRYRSDPEMLEPVRPSKCSRFIYYTWKVIRCLFSHIALVSMVVSYCILGAFTFTYLERDYEIQVKHGIKTIRQNVTEKIWNFTKQTRVLHQENWTRDVVLELNLFEKEILEAMSKNGWNGSEDTEQVQWTFLGALFYSIIVITTIGYGHIAPKTFWGKVCTIFYAILGIPLMLLCLSNIGDIMATSFRFLYWRVCCYVCTKRPKRHRRSRRERGGTVRVQSGQRYSNRSRDSRNIPSLRRSGRNSQKSADSGFGLSEITPTSFSENEYRYQDELATIPKTRPSQISRFSDSSASTRRMMSQQGPPQRGGSLDRRKMNKSLETALDPELLAKAPVLCNRYVVNQNETNIPKITTTSSAERVSTAASDLPARRAMSVPRQQHFLEPPRRDPSPTNSQGSDRMESKGRGKRRKLSPPRNPSPRIMSPLGYTVHRQKYIEEADSDLEYSFSEGYVPQDPRPINRPVPIWLCVFLVVSYIFAGAFLFSRWEDWHFLDSAYFCFITLTTIGFGDFVPAKRTNKELNIALCSLYLLFGISLLAMSFNLVQEEVITNVKSVAKTLGIIKSDEPEDEDD